MIPRQTNVFCDDRCSGGRMYKNALLNTLIHLEPKICLEIGTYHGGSAQVFQYYFDNYCSNGTLFTCDIKKYDEFAQLNLPNVKFIHVRPHVENSSDWHDVKDSEMIMSQGGSSAWKNIKRIEEVISRGYFSL